MGPNTKLEDVALRGILGKNFIRRAITNDCSCALESWISERNERKAFCLSVTAQSWNHPFERGLISDKSSVTQPNAPVLNHNGVMEDGGAVCPGHSLKATKWSNCKLLWKD